MTRIADGSRELGIRPDLLSSLDADECSELVRVCYRTLARVRHTDIAAKGDNLGFSTLAEAHDLIASGLSSGASFPLGEEEAFMPMEQARALAQAVEREARQIQSRVAECVAGVALNGPTVESLPAGTFTLFDYLASFSGERPAVGSLAQRADAARASFRNGTHEESELYELQQTYYNQDFVMEFNILAGGVFGGSPEGRLVGLLYSDRLEERLEEAGKILGVERPILRNSIPSAPFALLLEDFSPRLFLPVDPEVGIFVVTQRRSRSGYRYRIEGEVMSFQERGIDG